MAKNDRNINVEDSFQEALKEELGNADRSFKSCPYQEGIVFEVTDDGLHGKIVCLGESPRMQWTYDLNEASRLVGADSYTDGAYNMAKLMEVPDWETKCPV